MLRYRRGQASPWLPQSSPYVDDMTKRYQLVADRVPNPSGAGFFETLKMAVVEFSCLGETRFDLSGYPHQSEGRALAQDWDRLGQDALEAARKFRNEVVHNPRFELEDYKIQMIRLRSELGLLEEKVRAATEALGETTYGRRAGRSISDPAPAAREHRPVTQGQPISRSAARSS